MINTQNLTSFLKKDSQEALESCAKAIEAYNYILVVGHSNPDGDAVASTLALGFILKELGKECILYNESKIPNTFDFLPRTQDFVQDLESLPFNPQLIIVVDCGDRNRIGKFSDKLLAMAPSVNIDHHIANTHFGSLCNWADSSIAATGNAIALLALKLGVDLKDSLAFCLYTSLITDTGSFAYENTNVLLMLTATYMVEKGLVPARIYNALNNQWTENKMRLWSYLYNAFVLNKELNVAYCLLTKTVLEEYMCTKEDTEGFVEQLKKIKNVRIAFVLREENAFETKISLRSHGNDNVQKLAAAFGGGGHKNAAGMALKKSIAESLNSILIYIQENKAQIMP